MGHLISTLGWWVAIIGITASAWLLLGLVPTIVRRRRTRLAMQAPYAQSPNRLPDIASGRAPPQPRLQSPINQRDSSAERSASAVPELRDPPVRHLPHPRAVDAAREETAAKAPAIVIGTTTGHRSRAMRDGAELCSVCGEPGERFTSAQPNFLCRKHWLEGMPNPLEFERMLAGRS